MPANVLPHISIPTVTIKKAQHYKTKQLDIKKQYYMYAQTEFQSAFYKEGKRYELIEDVIGRLNKGWEC